MGWHDPFDSDWMCREGGGIHSQAMITWGSMQVWEVAAQLLGLALSIGVLKGIEATHVPQNVLWIWALAQTGHVGLRFKSLSSLQLTVVNQKRACLLIRAYLRDQPLPGAPLPRHWS